TMGVLAETDPAPPDPHAPTRVDHHPLPEHHCRCSTGSPDEKTSLLHNFIDKITASKHKLTITTRYYDDGEPITHEQLTRHNNMGTR
ncbi:hypothetical protein, partial [Luteococcus sediminum]